MTISNRELLRAVEMAETVPGMFRRDEMAFLYRLARRKGNIVELGCYMGRSTAILVQAAQIFDAQVTTVDSFTSPGPGLEAATQEVMENNLRRLGLPLPEVLDMTTDEAVHHWPEDRPIALLFIDASHEEKQVLRDLQNWSPLIQMNGILAMHDLFQPSCVGVLRAVARWWQPDRWALIGLRDYTLALRRVERV